MMAGISDVRSDIATIVSTVGSFDIKSHPFAVPQALSGWVLVNKIEPVDFESSLVTFAVVIFLGSDEAKAEELLDTYGIDLVNTVTKSDLHTTDVSITPTQAAIGSSGAMFALELVLTTEVN